MKLLLFPAAAEIRASRAPTQADTCTMCGDFCAMKKSAAINANDIGEAKQRAAAE